VKSDDFKLFVLEKSLAVGDRIKMSERGLERHPRYLGREGVIVRKGAASSWRIRFDGQTSVQTIHNDYLEKIE
jgi:hypothetical protein